MFNRVPFSKRQKQASEAGKPLVYEYDKVPAPLRKQVVLILKRALGTQLWKQESFLRGNEPSVSFNAWNFIFQRLREERGEFKLHDEGEMPDEQVCNFLLSCDRDGFIDGVELSLVVVDAAREFYENDRAAAEITETPDDAINGVNFRFQENRFGYTYVRETGEMVRIDSQFLHKEAVEKAFSLLQQSGFEGPENEFQEAHRKYREGRHKDAILDALKAFESTLKTICDWHKWVYSPNASAKELIGVVFDHDLLASSQQSFFSALRTLLECGLPTVRNKTSGHGQGAAVVEVPQHVAAFALHLAASSIVLLAEADKAKA